MEENTPIGSDWTDLFPKSADQKAVIQQNGLLFAQRYLCFAGPTADPRARELLAHWTALARRVPIPRGASVQEYAAANAFREFVEAIHAQIEFAQQGLNQPTTRTA